MYWTCSKYGRDKKNAQIFYIYIYMKEICVPKYCSLNSIRVDNK